MSAAVSLNWQGDFEVDDRGVTVMVDGDAAYIQRIIRRLLTGPRLYDTATRTPVAAPDYIFRPEFGAGLRRLVNQTINRDELVRIIYPQILADPETDQRSRPKVEAFQQQGGLVIVNITAVRIPNRTLLFGVQVSGS